jgi:hypothetical protein
LTTGQTSGLNSNGSKVAKLSLARCGHVRVSLTVQFSCLNLWPAAAAKG